VVKLVEKVVKREGLKCEYFNHVEQALRVVDLDRLSVALLPEMNGLNTIAKLKLQRIKAISDPLYSHTLHHYLHAKNAHLVDKLNAILQDMTHSGEVALIRAEQLQKRVANL